MIVGEELVVKIEKMLYEGASLARHNNIPIFIQGGCTDDVLKVKIKNINKNYIKAEIIEIIEPSPYRTEPICHLHNVCGSCNWQYISYERQLKEKQNIVAETIKKIAGVNIEITPIIPSPLKKEYRCKIQLPVEQTKVSKRILTGYYKKNSHELINIKFCPMQPNIINEINELVKEETQKIGIIAYDEKKHSGLLRHIIYRISSDLSQILVIFVLNSNVIDEKINKLSKIILEKFPLITGVAANFNTSKTNVILGKDSMPIIGNDYYIESLNEYKFKISANSFFQVNPTCAKLIFDKVKELISSKNIKPTILDAYSGVSSFGIWLSSIASKVISVEEVVSASKDAVDNLALNHISNIEIINGDATIVFDKLIKNNTKFDVSVTDPPRKGCSIESIENLVKLTNKYIVYVSCNVATLARDMKILEQKGFKPIYIQPVDLFPNTYHIETIAMFEKV